MNYYRRIDREQIQFDFLTHRPQKDDYDDEIESLGGRIYHAPRLYPQNLPAYSRFMKDFFANHPEYKIMHSHIDAMSYLPLREGKKAGVPVRIAHSHNTAIDKDMKRFLKLYYRSRITSVSTHYLACGREAGEFLFPGKEAIVIPNAIEKDRFRYDKEVRMRKRKELGITEELVFGHIGRISYQKNHKFLVDIFSEAVKMEPNSLLLIIGVGEKEDEIREHVKNLGLDQKVRFLGKRTDVNELYQAMDLFVMPSYFEGVPVVGIEAQFAHLSCFFSDKVPEEVAFSPLTHFISLNATAKDWAVEILDQVRKVSDRESVKITDERYDIDKSYMYLENYYKELYAQIERNN